MIANRLALPRAVLGAMTSGLPARDRTTSSRPGAGGPVWTSSRGNRSRRTRSLPGPEARPGTETSASAGLSWWATMGPFISGTPGMIDDRPDDMSLGHATSPDGTHWTRDPHNPIFTGSWVEDMCVVKQDGTYQMFAEGKNDIAHRLTSPDGVHWTEQGSLDIRKTNGTPISPGPYGTPTAWFENGTWYLFYERGDQGVWLATSRDLKTWTNIKDDPGPGVRPRAPMTRQPWRSTRSSSAGRITMPSTMPMPTGPGRTGQPTSPARATWFTGRNTRATRSSRTTARAPSSSHAHRAIASIPCTRTSESFEPASRGEVSNQR